MNTCPKCGGYAEGHSECPSCMRGTRPAPVAVSAERRAELVREAQDILSGGSLRLPTREHLAALSQDRGTLQGFVAVLTHVLIAIMMDTGQYRLTIPHRILDGIRARKLDVTAEVVDGYLVVALKRPAGDGPLPMPDGPSSAVN